MKKIFLYLTVVSLALGACEVMPDPVFDESASHRLTAAVEEAQKVLMAAPNGWLVEYYPNSTQKFGGFNLLFKFKDHENVEVRSQREPAATVASLYNMGEDRGPTVNMSSYNRLLHVFADPGERLGSGKGYSYQGDYEFVIEKAAADEVIMMGKKTQNRIRMTPWDGGSWDTYCTGVAAVELGATVPTKMTVAGVDVAAISKDPGGMRYTFNFPGQLSQSMPFIAVPGGFKCYEPVVLAGNDNFPAELRGVTMRNFRHEPAARRFVCTDAGVDATIEYRAVPKYETQFAGTYTMNYSNYYASTTRNRSATVRIEDAGDNYYYLVGLLNEADEEKGDVLLRYIPGIGLRFTPQNLFKRIITMNVSQEPQMVNCYLELNTVSGWTTTDSSYGVQTSNVVTDDVGNLVSFELGSDYGGYSYGPANGLYASYYNNGYVNMNDTDTPFTCVNGDRAIVHMQFIKQ